MHVLSFRRTCLVLGAACLAVVVPVASGQQTVAPTTAISQAQNLPAESSLAFGVASVKQNKSGQPTHISDPPDGDGLTIRSMSLEQILEFAYEIQSSDLLVGVPDWVKSGRYDIQAKVNDSDLGAYHKLDKAQHAAMLQAVLIDRFKMSVHRAPKDISTYALVLAKNGSKMTQVKPGQLRTTGVKELDGTVDQGELLFSRAPGQLVAQEVPTDTLA